MRYAEVVMGPSGGGARLAEFVRTKRIVLKVEAARTATSPPGSLMPAARDGGFETTIRELHNTFMQHIMHDI